MKKLITAAIIALLANCHVPQTATFKKAHLIVNSKNNDRTIIDKTFQEDLIATSSNEKGSMEISDIKTHEDLTVSVATKNNGKMAEILNIKINGKVSQYASARGHQLRISGDVKSDTLVLAFDTGAIKGVMMFTK